ncbi:MAG: helix-turn-helix domain-containing protein [Stomatobaculum sp.]
MAERVGYRDIAYFSASFKKMTGRSPSEYLETGERKTQGEAECAAGAHLKREDREEC